MAIITDPNTGQTLETYISPSGAELVVGTNTPVGQAFNTQTNPIAKTDSSFLSKDYIESQYAAKEKSLRDILDQTLTAIRGQGESLIAQQKDINKRTLGATQEAQFRLGTARYAPEFSTGVMSETETYGLNKIGEINAKIALEITNAQNAFEKDDMSLFTSKMDMLKDLQDTQDKATATALKVFQDKQKEIDKAALEAKTDNLINQTAQNLAQKTGMDLTTAIDKGNLTYSQLLQAVNKDAKGNFVANATGDQVKKIFDEYMTIKKTQDKEMGQDYNLFQNWKSNNQLPSHITSLKTEAEQFAAFKQQILNKPTDLLTNIEKLLNIEKLKAELASSNMEAFDKLPDTIGNIPMRAFKDSLMQLLGSKKYSADDRAFAQKALVDKLMNGEINGAREFLTKQAISDLPSTTQDQAIGRTTALNSLDYIQSLIQQAQKAGAPTGLLSGNLEKIAEKLGTTKNPALANLATALTTFLITYRASMTGKQFSLPESKQYQDTLPDITNFNTLNASRITTLRNLLNINQRSVLEFELGKSNYQSIFGDIKPTILKSPDGKTTKKFSNMGVNDLNDALKLGWTQLQ